MPSIPLAEPDRCMAPNGKPSYNIYMRKSSAFTLIELLVVIALIGILASFVTMNLNVQQRNARDANRRDSLRGYQTALEQWRIVKGNYGIGSGSGGVSVTKPVDTSIANTLQTNGYLATIQYDPNPTWDYWLTLCTSDITIPYPVSGSTQADAQEYGLGARLENKNNDTATLTKGLCNNTSLNTKLVTTEDYTFGLGSRRHN